MNHPIQLLMEQRRNGQNCGIESVCSANEYVLEVALRRSKLFNAPVLIEATANQVCSCTRRFSETDRRRQGCSDLSGKLYRWRWQARRAQSG